jgi:predicted membrane-bound spermidine synthase
MLRNSGLGRVLFVLFFASGFCGLLYQVVWVRLAFASFGIVTPVLSVVISVFMLGLAVGSWLGGSVANRLASTRFSAAYLYAAVELGIGVGAFVVPALFQAGARWLSNLGEADSTTYLTASGVVIAVAILPWCVFMGATYPAMMGFVRERESDASRSFSFLYLANVMGATFGALVTAVVLVEVLGFRHTLWVAGCTNAAIAVAGCWLARGAVKQPAAGDEDSPARSEAARPAPTVTDGPITDGAPRQVPWAHTMLFATGLISLAMEVVWTRTFTPILGTQVYSFAALLVVYLVATWFGSQWYRRDIRRDRVLGTGQLLAIATVVAFLPVLMNDPRLFHGTRTRMLVMGASLFPLCAVLGYLTPRLVDLTGAGHPRLAGRAYALNVLGCIIGPLLASYVLLPWLGAKLSLILLAAPLAVFAWRYRRETAPAWRLGVPTSALLAVIALLACVTHEAPSTGEDRSEVRRDYAATVISTGEGMHRRLLVNGVGITELTPITKYIAHLPLGSLEHQPQSGLVICFGMGTTYRSLLAWGIDTTAVELVPSVRDAFGYYHADATEVMANPLGRVVIDDGRRFLDRTDEKWDVIVIDPPPPIEAAGSSLLYSREFHEAVRRHLKPGGIFQSWSPVTEPTIEQAIARSLCEVFPYVRLYDSVEGWGRHYLASMTDWRTPTAAEFVARLPEHARADLAEWNSDPLADARKMLGAEVPAATMLNADPSITITDDRPLNEYYLLRRLFAR